jgi:chitodextrinase
VKNKLRAVNNKVKSYNNNRPDQRKLVITLALLIAIPAALVSIHFKPFIFASGSGTLSLSPATSNIGLGNNFTVSVYENSGSTAVNAVEADLTFPTTKLQFVNVDASSSAFGVEAASAGNNTNGTVTLARGVSNGATVTGNQLVAVVTFEAAGTGSAAINFANSSAIVEAAGNTNILGSETGGTYSIADTTPPSVPTGLAVSTHSVTSLKISWAASTDNVGVTGYKIYRNGTQVGTSTTTSYTDSGLTPGTTYTYKVAAYDAAGNTSAQSSGASLATTPDTSPPTVPAGLIVTSQTSTSVGLQWTASTDNVGVTGYKIYRNGSNAPLATVASGTTYQDNNVSANASYTYQVSAYDAAGNESAKSTAVVATTPSLGDINGDDKVNIFDLSILLSNYGKNTSQASNKAADLNGDGVINVFDLSILLTNFGT